MVIELAIGLAVAAAVLIVCTVATARRPAEPVPDAERYLDRWSRLHAGYDPRGNVWVRGWLVLAYRLARPLARCGVAPDALTLWSMWLAAAVFVPATAGDRWLVLAGALVVVSGFGDTLDGTVAALTDRATRWGYALDSLVDRVSDLLYLAALVVAGGPPSLALGCGVLFLLHEYLRARAGNAGGGEIGAITVAERPTRVIVIAATLVTAGVAVAAVDLVVVVGLWALLGLSLVGFAHLLVVVRRRLLVLGRTPLE